LELRAGNTLLPSPTEITIDDEIMWSSDTGRNLAGSMVGDVVATKKKVGIKWGVLKEEELLIIKQKLVPGFFPFAFWDDGRETTIESYRGTLSKVYLGCFSGVNFYKSASASIIQR